MKQKWLTLRTEPEMAKKEADRLELLQGTLEMMILRTLLLGPTNGYQIAKAIERMSDEVLRVDHSSLYPALHRLEKKGWLVSKWEDSESNRRAKSYRLTRLGRKQLQAEHSKWERLCTAISRVMRPVEENP
jgi:PadR family transcriptional regulator PadR